MALPEPDCDYCTAVGGTCWPHRKGVLRLLERPEYRGWILRQGADGGGTGGAPAASVADLRQRFGREPRYTPDCGVACAGEASCFVGTQLMLASLLLAHDVPVTCFDLGFTAGQRAWLARQGVAVVRPELPEGHRFEPAGNRWAQWVKPLLLEQSPHDVTVWLDSDTVVARDLAPLAAMARARGAVAFPEAFSPDPTWHRNRPALYESRPVAAEWASLNSGVMAFVRGHPFVALAADFLRAIIADPDLAAPVVAWDQGLIKWAFERCGVAPVDDPTWNRPGWTVAESGKPLTPAAVLARCEPGSITHFQCSPKPWQAWGPFSEPIRPGAGGPLPRPSGTDRAWYEALPDAIRDRARDCPSRRLEVVSSCCGGTGQVCRGPGEPGRRVDVLRCARAQAEGRCGAD